MERTPSEYHDINMGNHAKLRALCRSLGGRESPLDGDPTGYNLSLEFPVSGGQVLCLSTSYWLDVHGEFQDFLEKLFNDELDPHSFSGGDTWVHTWILDGGGDEVEEWPDARAQHETSQSFSFEKGSEVFAVIEQVLRAHGNIAP